MIELNNQDSTWDMTTLGELCSDNDSFLQTGPFGSQLHASDYTEISGIPVIMPANIGHRTVNIANIKRIKETDAKRLEKHRVKEGDIVYARRGNIGSHAFIKTNQKGWLCGTGCLLVRVNNDRILPEFLSFYLLQESVTNWILRHAVGTTMANLNTKILSKVPVIIPPLPEQKAIASILGALDDKIELNNEMNQTLETMARALYKSWFVDFDPVVAKAAGKKPLGMDDETAALFPDKFVDSELGPIPEGWNIKQLEEIADVNWGDTNVTKKSYVEEGYTAYSAKGPDGKLPYYDYSVDGVVLSAIGANCGLTWFAQDKWSCIKNTIRIIPKTEQINIEFIYYATDDPDAWPIRGSAQPFISQGDARKRKIIVPTNEIAKTFGNSVRDWHKITHMNYQESQTLYKLLDLLLPKLISGEIRIKDAEKVVEEVL